MVTLDNIRSVIAAAAPLDPDVDGVLERADGDWVVRYPDLDVEMEFDADTQRFALSANLDTVDPELRLEVYTTLLSYSLLWRDTGGIGMALDASGTVVQQMILFAPEVTADLLGTVLPNFVVKARLLRTYIGNGGQSKPTPKMDDTSFLNAIRV